MIRGINVMNTCGLVSVIMPVYNAGEYLCTAINAILNQSYKKLELVCIDDASTDFSSQILAEYANKDNRVVVYTNTTNCGAAVSRNKGISLAKGEYIYFVDADDIFEEKLIEQLMDAAVGQSSEIVYVHYDIFGKNSLTNRDCRNKYYYFSDELKKIARVKGCPKEFIKDMLPAPYGRLYAKGFVEKHGLLFQNLKSSNDIYFGIMATLLSEKIVHTDKYENLIHVREHGSKFRISNNRNPLDNFEAYIYLKQELQKRGLWNEYKTVIQERFLENITHELTLCKENQGRECYDFLKTQGMKEMAIWDSYDDLDLICHAMADLFENEKFEDMLMSYKKIDKFSLLICEHSQEIKYLFRALTDSDKNCAIWGAGKNGKILAEFCAKNNIYFKGFVDNDRNKWRSNLFGYTVYMPEEIGGIIDTLIIIRQDHFNQIYDQITRMNVQIDMLSLDLYLRYGMGVEASTVKVD